MTEKTFHTVSWAPSAIKDAVEHATEAFKAADGAYARVSTFELSALIDATRALIEHNEREETNLKPEAPQVSMEELKERIDAVVNDYTAGEDYGSGPTRYYLTVGTPDELTEHLAAGLFSGMELLFKVVADWQALWDTKEEWEKAAKEAWQRETVLSWLHAEAMWHAEHHRAQVEAHGLSHALLLKGVPDLLKQIDAQGRQIKALQAQLDQKPQSPAFSRKPGWGSICGCRRCQDEQDGIKVVGTVPDEVPASPREEGDGRA